MSMLQLAARRRLIAGIMSTKFVVPMEAKLRFIGKVFWKIVCPVVSLVAFTVIVPVTVLAVVSTVIEPLVIMVKLSNVTVLLKVVV